MRALGWDGGSGPADMDAVLAQHMDRLMAGAIQPFLAQYPEAATGLIARIAAVMADQAEAARRAGARAGVDAVGQLASRWSWRRRSLPEVGLAAAILFPHGVRGHAPAHVARWREFLEIVRAAPDAREWVASWVPDGARWWASVVQPALDAGEEDR